MRRTASEVLNTLEMRVARLEKNLTDIKLKQKKATTSQSHEIIVRTK